MGIMDLFRSKPAARPPAVKLTTELAFERLTNTAFELPDADEILKKAGLTRVELRKVAADDEISAAIETRLTALQSVPWRLDPWLDDPIATEVWDMLAPHMEAIITGAFNARLYGYSVMEAVYVRQGSRIVIGEITEKPFEWFEPKRDGTLMYRQYGRAPELVDTHYKFFLTRYQPTYLQPRGQALLSTLYWPWKMRSQGWRFWAKFLERFGSPFAVGQTRGSPEDMATALAQLVQGGVAAFGFDDVIDIKTPASAGESFDKFDTAIAKRIQKVVLGQTLTSDVQGGGSFAAAKVQDLVRGDRKTADIRMVTRTVQQIIVALGDLNFPGAKMPEFILEDGEGLGLERAGRDGQLVRDGVLTLTEQYILDKYDFEEGDFEIPVKQPVRAALAEPGSEGEEPAEEFAARKFSPDQAALEALIGSAIRKTASPIPPEVIREAINAATSADDLRERLGTIFAQFKPDDFAEITERALFAADVMGYAHAGEGVEG